MDLAFNFFKRLILLANKEKIAKFCNFFTMQFLSLKLKTCSGLCFYNRNKFLCNHAVHNIWICMHSSLLCVGESDRHARDKKHFQEGSCSASSGDTHLVSGDHIPILWPY